MCSGLNAQPFIQEVNAFAQLDARQSPPDPGGSPAGAGQCGPGPELGQPRQDLPHAQRSPAAAARPGGVGTAR